MASFRRRRVQIQAIRVDASATDEARLRAVDVAAQTGCTVRQLRTLIEEGLVPKAVGTGRGAWYTAEHVARASEARYALKRGFTHRKLRNASDIELPVWYWLDRQALQRAADSDQTSTSVSTYKMLTCGIHLVVQRDQSVEMRRVQQAVLKAIAKVLEHEHERVIDLIEALRLSQNQSAALCDGNGFRE